MNIRGLVTASLLGAALGTVSACASGGGLSDQMAGASRVKGDATSVRIYQATSRADAFPLAIGHCSHFGLSAQYASHAGGAYVFRCVKP